MHDVAAIVVGAGHNGLICAAYLARAGVDTLLLEARSSVGGCASTVDAIGARVNICSCDHTVFRSTPVMDELGLAAHGLRYLDVEPAQLHVHWDGGPAWPIFHDVERTLEALAHTYPDQVDGYRRYLADALPVARLALAATNDVPTRRALVGRVVERRGRGVATMLAWGRRSVAEVLRRYFTAEQLLGPPITTGPGVWGLSPFTPRTGLGALTYALKHITPTGRPEGGSGALTQAVLGAYEASGGKVRCDARVAAITCEGTRVRGVRLVDGTEITASVVISAADPHQTFVDWLRDPPAAAQSMVQRWRRAPAAEGYESKLDAVVSRLPRYRGVDADLLARLGVRDPLVPTMIVSPSVDAMARAHQLLGQGGVAERPMHYVNLPSVLDPTMRAADGHHVLSLETLFTPYQLRGGWDEGVRTEPERWLAGYGELVEPGFLDGVERWRVMTPVSYETEFNLRRGHAPSFAGGALAALLPRAPELVRYSTPVAGLFITGAATFPGAGVWGAPGRNAASAVLADRRAGL